MRGRLVRWAAAAVVLGAALVALGAAVSAEVRFLLRAGYEEARLLSRRRPLDRLVADPRTPPDLRGRFELVLAARAFAADSLAFAAGDTYTTYADIGRDTLVLVLSASPRTRLAVHTWWFPVVGAVPYHGYFTLAAGQAAAAGLEARGYDTYLRPAAAFSTLGWFSDPLVSSAMARDSVTLVSTVLHEISHNTVYVPSATEFDESLANFAGLKGAEAFFRARGEAALAAKAAAQWRDELRLGEFYRGLAAALDSVYARPVDEAAKLAARRAVFSAGRERMATDVGPRLESYRAEWFADRTLNNATVIAARIYRTRLPLFEAVLARHGGQVREAVRAIGAAVHLDPRDPFGAVERLAGAGGTGGR